jgi:hypothetical protein
MQGTDFCTRLAWRYGQADRGATATAATAETTRQRDAGCNHQQEYAFHVGFL